MLGWIQSRVSPSFRGGKPRWNVVRLPSFSGPYRVLPAHLGAPWNGRTDFMLSVLMSSHVMWRGRGDSTCDLSGQTSAGRGTKLLISPLDWPLLNNMLNAGARVEEVLSPALAHYLSDFLESKEKLILPVFFVFLQAQIFWGMRQNVSFPCTVSNIHVTSVALSDVSLLLKTFSLFFQHQWHPFHRGDKMRW